MTPPRPDFLGLSRRWVGVCAALYLLLLIYGTLYPFHGWVVPRDGFLSQVLMLDSDRFSKTDLVTNVLVYLPFGVLLGGYWGQRTGWFAALLLAGLMGTGLSFSLEAVQVFLPARTSALSDLALNALGTISGALLAWVVAGKTLVGARLRHLRNDCFAPGAQANIGLMVLCLWILSQLSPLVPSLGISTLRHGLKPIWHTLTGQVPFIPAQALVYFCSIAALGGIALSISRSRRKGLLLMALVVVTVLLLKVPVLSRQLSLEALLGCAGGLLVLFFLNRTGERPLLIASGVFLAVGFIVDTLRASPESTQLIAFNWIPFRGHMQNLVGLTNILAGGWVFLGAGYVVRYLTGGGSVRVLVSGGMLVIGLAALMEWLQRSIPGRSPDITDILIAVVAWGCAWLGGLAHDENGH